MGFPIVPHQACAVYTEDGMQVVNGNVVYQHIIASLEERRVHGENRDEPLFGHTRSHGHGVFLCDPPILILDEATSSVDTRTEVEIGKAMKQLMDGRTSFVIAHRLSTIRDADNILFMANGNIIEQGDHKTLLAKKGAYAALYYSQFE